MSAKRHITDRKRVKKTVRPSKDFYRKLIEGSPDAIWVHCRNKVVYANRACAAFFGASCAEELLGRKPLDFVHPDDLEIVKKRVHTVYTERKPVIRNETRWIRLDGKEVYSDVIATPVEFQGEKGAQTIFRDISERRRMEQNLRKSEASLATAQRTAHLGSWERDIVNVNEFSNGPAYWSDEVFRILGYEPGQIDPSNRNFLQSVHPDDRERVRSAVASALHENKLFSEDYRIILPNGNERIVHCQGEFIFDEDTHKALKLVGTVQDITAQKKAEEKFQGLLEAAPDAIVVTNEEGKIVLVNSQTEKLFGYKREELLDNPIEILMPERFRGGHRDQMTGFLAYPLMRSMGDGRKLFAQRKDGSQFRVEISLSPLETEEGTLITRAIRDITANVQAEEELLRYEAIVHWSNDAIIGFALDGIITSWNRGAERMFGFSLSEAVGKSIAILAPSDRVQEPLVLVDEMIKGTRMSNIEAIWMTKCGELIEVSISLSPINSKDGQILGGSAIVRDVTELRTAERRFQKVFNGSPEPMSIASLSEGRYIDVNERFLHLTGYRRSEVIGHTSLELKIWERLEDRVAIMEELKSKGAIRDFEKTIRTKNGEHRAVLVSFDLVEFAGQRCLIAIVKDVTEKQRLEQQLRQVQKMEAVGQLAGGIAHDFNNLLNVICGYSELLLEDIGSNKSLRGRIEEVKKAGERGASLVQQLLAFSRKQVLEPRVINLDDVLKNFQTMLGRVIGENIELHIRANSSAWSVKVDPVQIEQIILNLSSNARDAMPRGGTLTLETSNVTLEAEFFGTYNPVTPGDYVVLVISDTGIGMDDSTQKRIFEPFFTTKEVGKGTGLGLATVYGIVKQSAGYIWVDSEVGKGTTFKIFFPRVKEMPQALTLTVPTQQRTGGTETILVVEDDKALCAVLCESLSRNGYTVLKSHTGGEAIQIEKHYPGPIDLVVTDIIMPGMTGPELADKFRASRPQTKVLLVSGYAQNLVARHVVFGPGTEFLQKPYSLSDVARKIRDLLREDSTPGVGDLVTAGSASSLDARVPPTVTIKPATVKATDLGK